ncbi:thioredoxin domain-containing protein [Cysteiniphilum sp. JM-1]|uniref:thioredoxin domain-containing protein n=1 Tax=Cysteiniphilum sp. JM-1 TaxID=2610891 RepID=UPI0012480E05|nr:thioredoxin domain-containing protein [Cysteiniphilum sp. JM-1]
MRMSKKIIVSTLGAALFATVLAGCSQSDSKDSAKATPEVTKTVATQPTATETAKPVTAADAQQSEATLINNVSYTLGYSVAGNVSAQLKAQGATLDNAQVLAGFKAGIANEKGKFSQEQMQTIMQTFQKDLMAAQEKKQVTSVLENAKALLSNEQTPTVGPKDAKVAVIEFFDYQCVFCHKVAPIMEKVMDANPNVKYIFKEFPIFGQRWEASQYAAEMGIAAYMLNGAEGYLKYHNAVFASGVDEGKLTVKDVNDAAKKVGVDVAKAESLIKEKKVTDNIAADMKLGFDKLGIQGTPAIIVMPLSGATAANTTVIPGFAQQDAIQAAINKAQGK